VGPEHRPRADELHHHPCQVAHVCPDWEQQGHIATVLRNAAAWVEAQKVAGLKLEVIQQPGRTPVIFFEVEGTAEKASTSPTVLMYGHLDKQPEFEGWRSDLGPWTPKYEDGKLYGRGGADDGYAVYASVAAIQELKRQNVTRASWPSSRPARKAARPICCPMWMPCARAWAMWAW
jgi:acetylornithine deacetylase/succinyl-diaminopimelate desuccinylase-like protein